MRRMRLQNKFIIITVVLVILLGLAGVIFVRTTLTEQLIGALQKKGIFITNALAHQIINPVLTENILDLQLIVNDQKGTDEDIEYIFVLDSEGQVLAHSFEKGFPIDLKKATIFGSGQQSGTQFLDTEKGLILDIAQPILDGAAGVVHVGFTEANIRTVVANISRQIIGIIMATLVLGIGVAIVVAIVITKPISEIADVAKAVGGGDFGRKVQVKTKDEIGELGAVFNKMINERKQAEERLLTYQERLRSLSSELFLAEERERRRIATGLHDHIGQTLVFSKIKLGEIQKSWPSSSPSGALIEIKELIDQMIKETRSLTFELSLPVLYELGLEPAIEWLAERNQELYGIPTGFYDDGRPKPLEDSVRVFLFQSARELLFNIAKHSRAQNSNVSIHRNGGNIQIQIDDDGVGFEMSGPNLEKSRNKGFGLFSIRERLSHIGGRLDLKTEPGRGTKAVLTAPLQH